MNFFYKRYFLLIAAFSLMLIYVTCGKEVEVKDEVSLKRAINPGITGEWELTAINSNERWGGELKWSPSVKIAYVKFADNGKYFRKEDGEQSYNLRGSYILIDDKRLEITDCDNKNKSIKEYHLEGNQLTLLFGFEGVTGEKFVRIAP
ncbi:lipocalin family protein [Rubrolithibacter danxiaensis]|uniref:lipocalin family protein n=1 Tax=Rubrolithibacter danxiaensis TaxID=3390805 RepID=UPI003BF8B82E